MHFNQLTSMQKDVLREIGNIGAGNAATSLSKLLNKKIDMQVPAVNIVAFDEVMDLLGGPENLIVAIMFRIHGDAPGTVFFILSMEEAVELVNEVTGNEITLYDDDQVPNDLAISALQEIGNILTGSYLSALSDFTDLDLHPSIPYFGIDMAGAILTVGLNELSQVSDYAIIIDTKINKKKHMDGNMGQFFFLPDPEAFSKLFHALGINGYE
ncbi:MULTISPECIES: chemotaxis protein CheC [unclassified Virgibacillus]|uniref:chemotaxis protein CheC n=1 Tax=unclassified Virgibacillus TaxID=2620237 RepID=UPI0024DE5D05|nr:chemotaxis protein CheC [Virgibacillus sp. LDC-1]